MKTLKCSHAAYGLSNKTHYVWGNSRIFLVLRAEKASQLFANILATFASHFRYKKNGPQKILEHPPPQIWVHATPMDGFIIVGLQATGSVLLETEFNSTCTYSANNMGTALILPCYMKRKLLLIAYRPYHFFISRLICT